MAAVRNVTNDVEPVSPDMGDGSAEFDDPFIDEYVFENDYDDINLDEE